MNLSVVCTYVYYKKKNYLKQIMNFLNLETKFFDEIGGHKLKNTRTETYIATCEK